MLTRSIWILLAFFSSTTLAYANSSFSYDLVINGANGYFTESDEAPLPQVGSTIQSAPSNLMANASARADCGILTIEGGANATGPRDTALQAFTSSAAAFEDEITILGTNPDPFWFGTMVARIEFFGAPAAMTNAPSTDVVPGGEFGVGATVGNCGPCGGVGGLSGYWSFANGQVLYTGDPIAAFETTPITFAYNLPLPISMAMSMNARAQQALTDDPVTAGGFFGAVFTIAEIRDDMGNLIDPPVASLSGCEYVPEPFAPTLGAGMLAALAATRQRKLGTPELCG